MKHKIFIVVIFLLNSITFMAAGQDSLMYVHQRWLIGINFSTDYCDRILHNNDTSEIMTSVYETRNDIEDFIVGYSTGLNVYYKLTQKWGLEAGLQYSNKGYQIDISDLFFGDQIPPRYGFNYESTKVLKIRYNFNYLDIPISIKYEVGQKKFSMIGGLGITTNILLRSSVKSVTEDEEGMKNVSISENTKDFNTLNLSATCSAGIKYSLNSKVSFRAEAAFRYGMLEINDGPLTQNLWSTGINISCFYKLK